MSVPIGMCPVAHDLHEFATGSWKCRVRYHRLQRSLSALCPSTPEKRAHASTVQRCSRCRIGPSIDAVVPARCSLLVAVGSNTIASIVVGCSLALQMFVRGLNVLPGCVLTAMNVNRPPSPPRRQELAVEGLPMSDAPRCCRVAASQVLLSGEIDVAEECKE